MTTDDQSIWRARLIKLGILVVASMIWGCSSASSDTCHQTEDCFSDETCVDGVCQMTENSNQTSNDASNDSPSDTLNEEQNNDSNSDDPEQDCVENVGICGDQYCHPSLRECVDCVRNDHCEQGVDCDDEEFVCRCPTGTHDCQGQCVADDDPAHCGDRCEPCPEEIGAVSTCEDGACGFECEVGFQPCSGPGCQTHCIECQSDSDCGDRDRSRCYEGQCQACVLSEDCAHHDEAPVCDRDTGTCIQCTVEESGACDGNSCDPATNECTDTQLRSLSVCDRCVADEECRTSQRCVPMFFAGQARPDGYCLYREEVRDCQQPYPMHVDRVSLSGYPETRYCSVREEKLTCEALDDYTDRCDEDHECGAANLDDGLCMSISEGTTQTRCTHACTTSNDCHITGSCIEAGDGICTEF